jgi:hypothetical protein
MQRTQGLCVPQSTGLQVCRVRVRCELGFHLGCRAEGGIIKNVEILTHGARCVFWLDSGSDPNIPSGLSFVCWHPPQLDWHPPQSAGRSPDRLRCNAPQSFQTSGATDHCRGNGHVCSWRRWNGLVRGQIDRDGRTNVTPGSDAPLRKVYALT